MKSPQQLALLPAVALVVLLGGCTTGATPGATTGAAVPTTSGTPAVVGVPATWQLSGPTPPAADATTLTVEVTRFECSSGVTGELLDPVVDYRSDRIVIRIDAAPRDPAGGSCPMNDAVPVTIELSEPVGERVVLDGACLQSPAQGSGACPTDHPDGG